MMTKRDFIALADALKGARQEYVSEELAEVATIQWGRVVRDVANVCAESNGRFDRERFYTACGLYEEALTR